MPRLYTKEAATAAGVHVSTGKDVIDAVNELHSTVFTDSGTTLEHLLARVAALENGEAPPSLPAAPVLSYTDLLFNSVSLSWTDPDSTGNFEIWDNGSKIGNSTLTSIDLVLVPETTHELHIYAVQGAIKSVASNVISITAPGVPNVTHSVVDVTDTTIDLSFANLINGASINVTVGGSTTTITGTSYQITGQTAGSIVNISYTQTVDGQTSASTPFSVTMDAATPTVPANAVYFNSGAVTHNGDYVTY